MCISYSASQLFAASFVIKSTVLSYFLTDCDSAVCVIVCGQME